MTEGSDPPAPVSDAELLAALDAEEQPDDERNVGDNPQQPIAPSTHQPTPPSTGIVKKEAWELAEENDDRLLMEEIEGKVLEDYVYSFADKGKKKHGLTLPGVRWAARKLKLTIEPPVTIIDTPERVIALAVAVNPETGQRWAGASECSKKDPFAAAKAVSKAQRNALRGLFAEETVLVIIEEWRRSKAAGKSGSGGKP